MKEPRKNPKTVVAIFAYGNVFGQTMMCLVRDACRAANITSVSLYRTDLDGLADLSAVPRPPNGPWELTVVAPPQDALIDRCRAMCVTRFLKDMPDCEVLVMVDHDIQWAGADGKGYEGDLLHIARRCAETKGIVGAVISKKVRGQGIACLWKQETTEIDLGKEGDESVIPVWYMGAAFTAYHREALEKVSDTMDMVNPGFKPIFQPIVVPHPMDPQQKLHLSEDWALCHYARQLGIETYASPRPLITHWGTYGYTVVGDSQPEKAPPPPFIPGLPAAPQPALTFSLIHASRGRPEMARKSHDAWMERASGAHNIEYILSVDDDDESMQDLGLIKTGEKSRPLQPWPMTIKVYRGKNRLVVDAYNRGAHHATGDILVQVHDDLCPPKDWDKEIAARLDPKKPQVLQVGDGTPLNSDKPWLLTVTIMTRAWYEKAGYWWHPDYLSVFCDDDLSLKAQKEDAVVDGKDLIFAHAWGGADGDETYKRAYEDKNWKHGQRVFDARSAAGFPDVPGLAAIVYGEPPAA